jgi:hypothetical protein
MAISQLRTSGGPGLGSIGRAASRPWPCPRGPSISNVMLHRPPVPSATNDTTSRPHDSRCRGNRLSGRLSTASPLGATTVMAPDLPAIPPFGSTSRSKERPSLSGPWLKPRTSS